jgi:uridylate kinase
MVRQENPCQSRSSQGDVIAIAHRIASRPGGPDLILDLSAPRRVPVSAGAGGPVFTTDTTWCAVGCWYCTSTMATGPT